MSETERLVKFELLGQEYKFYTAASEEELRAIFSLVRQLVETDSSQNTGTLRVGKVAILACLNIASRYVKLAREFEGFKRIITDFPLNENKLYLQASFRK